MGHFLLVQKVNQIKGIKKQLLEIKKNKSYPLTPIWQISKWVEKALILVVKSQR